MREISMEFEAKEQLKAPAPGMAGTSCKELDEPWQLDVRKMALLFFCFKMTDRKLATL